MYLYVCPICKKGFSSFNKKRKTCSKQCSAKFQSRQIKVICATCGKELYVRKSQAERTQYHYCSISCQRKDVGRRAESVFTPLLSDKNWCITQYEQLSLLKIAKSLGCGETLVYKWFKKHGIKLDRAKWIKGDKHYLWKNGITSLCRSIRTCQKNMVWKKRVRLANEAICCLCGSLENLEVDHIKKFKFILQDNYIKTLEDAQTCNELWDVSNGRIVCRKCNKVDCGLNRKQKSSSKMPVIS